MTVDPDEVDSPAAAASRLYRLATDEFVATRDQLVRALRADGRRELAAQVKELRRPTIVAAELNRALHDAPSDREALIEAARQLAQGHHRLLAGESGIDLAGLRAAHRTAVAMVAAHARSHRSDVHAALEAASLDEGLHPQLRSATFAVEPTPTQGFDLLSAVPLTPRTDRVPPADRRRHTPLGLVRSTPDPGPGPTPDDGVAAQARRQAAVAARDLAQRRVAATLASRDKAAERVRDLKARLAEARTHLHDASRRMTEAEAALTGADAELERLDADRD